jgi:hypothetical protein
MLKQIKPLLKVNFVICMLIFGTFVTFAKADETDKSTSNSNQLDEKFTHFELKKGEKIQLIEPYASLLGFLSGETENYQYEDYRGTKFTAMELLHPLGVIINKTAPKGTEVLAESIIKKIDSKNTVLNEILFTATEFFKAMETRAAILPPSAGQVAIAGAEAMGQAISNSAIEQYSNAVRVKLELAFKQVYEQYKLDIDKGAIENVRKALFEKTLNALNEYMASYYDPKEFVFKGLILGGHAKGDLLKHMQNLAQKALPPVVTEYGHIKGSAGVILHSPRKVTTISTFNSREVTREQTVFTVTPTFWLTARFKQGQQQKAPNSTQDNVQTSTHATNQTSTQTQQTPAAANFASPADSLYWTAGSLWGEREIDIASLEGYEGLFIEMNLIVMGFTININQAFFFKEIMNPGSPSASAISFSLEHNGFKKLRREELVNGLGKIKFAPNAGYLNVFPIKNYSIDISTL